MPNAQERKRKNLLRRRFIPTIADNMSFAKAQGATVRARHAVPLWVQNTAKTPWSISQDNAAMCFVDVGQFDSY